MKLLKNVRFFTLLAVIFLSSCQQEKPTTTQTSELSKEQLYQDFEILRSTFLQANSGLYKYRTKESIDSIFSTIKKQIHSNMSYRNFYNLLWKVIDYTGSCHNTLRYPDSLDKALNQQKIFFPIPLKHINGKLFTNLKHDNIPLGSEIISINTIPQHQFSKLISNYVSTDGFNKTGKFASIDTDWLAFYIYLAIGEQSQFTIKYKSKESSIKKGILNAVNYKQFLTNYKSRHSKTYENRKNKDYNYRYIDSIQTGYLEVNTFALGGKNSDGHKKYAAFLQTIFTKLKSENTPSLIVDIRGNGGGNDPNDLLLYSYLTKRVFRENTAAFTIFQQVPNINYYIDDDAKELSNELREEFTIYKQGKYYQQANFNKVWQPNKNAFKGTIILLIDPYVASAGSLFASLVKSDEQSTLIGEETLGGYYGHTGHIPVSYQLPNTKLTLTFSIVDLLQDVKQLADQKFGDGVQPDIKSRQTYLDFLNHKDTQLNTAIEFIQKQQVLKQEKKFSGLYPFFGSCQYF